MNTQHEKVALVTGANRGIGKEIARQLCEQGFAVFVASRDLHKGKEAAEELCSLGHEAIFLQLDVTDPVSVKNACGTFSQKADHLDVLVNNAAILEDTDRHISISKLNVELLERTMKTNVLGPILVIQDFLPFLEKSKEGRIINLTSELGSLAHMQDHSPGYSISKTALNAVTRQFAACLMGKNIAVNSISPGWVKTEMGGEGATRSVEEAAADILWLATESPLNETGKYWKNRQAAAW